jgi:DNA-binding IclR family transcriptional regulator
VRDLLKDHLFPLMHHASLGNHRTRYVSSDGHEQLVAGIYALAVPILPPKRDAVASIAVNMTGARLGTRAAG